MSLRECALPNLDCPHCRSTYLHHDRVEVFERPEDAAKGMHVTVESHDQIRDRPGFPRLTVDDDLARNPSSRRRGVRIEFWCENCHKRSALLICQHKGETDIEFEPITPS